MPNILIIKPSSFGDIVHGLQVVQSLRQQMADCHISWVVRDLFAPLVEECETVDERFIYHREGGWNAFLELLKQLRQKRYDILIDMQGLARSGVMTFAARARRKLGRSDAREGARLFYREKAPLPPAGKTAHAVDILLQFLPLLGLSAELRGPLPFRSFKKGSPEVSLLHDLLDKNPLILFPESRRSQKNWGGFVNLTEQLLQHPANLTVIWAGNEPAATPSGLRPDRFYNRMGRTGIDEIIILINHARLTVANDSGPIHLAAALGKPVLAIFGPTSPERYGPYPLDWSTNHVIRAPEGDLRRLDSYTVYQAIVEILK